MILGAVWTQAMCRTQKASGCTPMGRAAEHCVPSRSVAQPKVKPGGVTLTGETGNPCSGDEAVEASGNRRQRPRP